MILTFSPYPLLIFTFRIGQAASILSNKWGISMIEKIVMNDLDILQFIQSKLLFVKLPYTFPGVSLDAVKPNQPKIDGSFFDIIHPASNLIDIMIGRVKGPGISPLVMATAIKMELLRFAKPLSRGHHFDKVHLWEKNILSPQEIVKKVEKELGELIRELGFGVNLFYGRFNLEYHTFTYIDCGFTKPLYYNAAQNQSVFLTGSCPPLGADMLNQFRPTQINLEPGDFLLFYSDHYIKNGNPDESSFNHYHLIPLIENHSDLEVSDISNLIKQALDEKYLKEEPQDNPIIIVLKITEDRQIATLKHASAKFSSDLTQLQAVRTFIQHVCQQAPGDCDKLGLQLQLVINEIFCNIVKHSYHNQSKNEITIEGQLTDNGIYFTLSDKGDSFNPTKTKYPNLAGDQEDGFGFFIIQQIADQLSYTPKTSEDEWNHLCIFKRYFSEEEQMDFSHHIQNQVLIITPKGENLDAKNAPSFKESVLNLIHTSGLSHLIFDLKQLQFIDSSGLGTFLSIQRTLNAQGGILKLANLNRPIRTMFEIVSMHRIFDIFNSTEEAVLSF
jgi:anti-anti-sigma factor